MSTGDPKKRKHSDDGATEIRLCYPGKQDVVQAARLPRRPFQRISGDPSISLNRLYFGDNHAVLDLLSDDNQVKSHVNLVYIDPPFATQSSFRSRALDHAYEDTLTGARYLDFLYRRILLIHDILAETGSFYIHLDEKMVFHVKVLLDELFGSKNFRNCITRKKCNPKNYTKNQYGNVADYILFYTKSDKYVWNRPLEAWTDERAKEYQYVEPETERRFMKVPVHAPGERNGETGQPWRDVLPPPGKHWQFPPRVLEEMDARGEIFWSSNNNPRRKIYLDENPGVGVQDIWMEFRDAHNQNVQISGYPTEKNPGLLKRIIEASSNPGDLILDCFVGSGTTLAVASSMGRRWIGADDSAESLRTVLSRFQYGTQRMGDYVKAGLQTGRKSFKTLDLFTGREDQPRVEQLRLADSPVKDFVLWVDPELVDTALPIVQRWEQGNTIVDLQETPRNEKA